MHRSHVAALDKGTPLPANCALLRHMCGALKQLIYMRQHTSV